MDFDGDFYVECSIDVNGWLGAPVIQGGDDCDNNNGAINPGATEIWYDGIDQDCSGGTDYDQDGDGQDSTDYNGIDCDDTDPTIYLGANDAWYDGVDSNCDGSDDFDQDGDGFMSDQYSGEDCDDTDAQINPGSLDDQGDGVDQNCDGYADEGLLPTADSLQLGDLVVTEVMQNPDSIDDVDGEWFEIYNLTSDSINLNGLSVSDSGTDSFTINRTLVIEAADYIVFGKNADTANNGGIDLDYSYGSQMTLSNSDDEIILENDLGLVDMIVWDNGQTFPDPTGTSMNLDPTYYNESDNDTGSNWCESTTVLASGDYGTPGSENESCGGSVSYTYANDVLPILSSNCISCHSGPFSSLSTLLNTQAGDDYSSSSNANMPWITAGDPSNSYMYLKIQGTAAYGLQMPRNGAPLSSTDQQIIEQWILQGAQ